MTTEPTGTTNEARVGVVCVCDDCDALRAMTAPVEAPPWTLRREHGTEMARGARADAAREDVPDLTRRLVEAEAKVARVEALAEWIAKTDVRAVAVEIRAALADPAPAEQ